MKKTIWNTESKGLVFDVCVLMSNIVIKLMHIQHGKTQNSNKNKYYHSNEDFNILKDYKEILEWGLHFDACKYCMSYNFKNLQMDVAILCAHCDADINLCGDR